MWANTLVYAMIPEHLLYANVVCMGVDNISSVSHFFVLHVEQNSPKKMPPVRGGGGGGIGGDERMGEK